MTKKEKKYVNDRIESEGFEYCFLDYSDFSDIKDEKFHELRRAFIKASDELKKYLGYEPL